MSWRSVCVRHVNEIHLQPMSNLRDEWAAINERKIKEVERTVYGGNMPAHNKQVMRYQLNKEDREELMRERDTTTSAVGDRFNQRIAE